MVQASSCFITPKLHEALPSLLMIYPVVQCDMEVNRKLARGQ